MQLNEAKNILEKSGYIVSESYSTDFYEFIEEIKEIIAVDLKLHDDEVDELVKKYEDEIIAEFNDNMDAETIAEFIIEKEYE